MKEGSVGRSVGQSVTCLIKVRRLCLSSGGTAGKASLWSSSRNFAIFRISLVSREGKGGQDEEDRDAHQGCSKALTCLCFSATQEPDSCSSLQVFYSLPPPLGELVQ